MDRIGMNRTGRMLVSIMPKTYAQDWGLLHLRRI